MTRNAMVFVVTAAVLLMVAAAFAEQNAPELPAAGRPSAPTVGWRVGDGPCSDEQARDALRRSVLGDLRPDGHAMPERQYSGRQCDLELNPCGYFEHEDPCTTGYVDNANGGCNSTPYVFETVTPYYGTITINGKSGFYNAGSTRDTDWYEVTLPQAADIAFACVAEFPVQIYIIDAASGCGSPQIIHDANALECEEAVIAEHLAAGTYWFWVGSQWGYGAFPCDSDYIITIEGFYAAPDCVTDCPFGSMIEGELPCFPNYYDDHNGGCNFEPYVFQPIEPSAEQIILCGEAGVYPFEGWCYRDMDWYDFILDEPREIEFCTIAAFEYLVWVIHEIDGCSSYMIVDSWTGAPCDVSCHSYAFEPGHYWVIFTTSDWIPLDCGRSYVVTVDGYTTPVRQSTWGSVKALYR